MTLTFPRHYQRRRGARPGTKETFVDHVEVDLEGNKGCGSTISVEIEFEVTKGYAPDFDDPGAGDEIEIIQFRPFVRIKSPSGFPGTVREYLECPQWLADTLRACVDESALKYEFSEDER